MARSTVTALACWGLLFACLALPTLALILPVKMPIGPMYWDSHLYLDALNRIETGQVPHVDFFAPVGPLGYYLFFLISSVFPDSQPMLAASWGVALVTVPIMVLICLTSAQEKPLQTLWIVAGFAAFTLLPFNTMPQYPFPGADGFGIYNRHGAQLLYVLTAALLLLPSTITKPILIGLLMTALFATKITAFLSGGLLCLMALIAGRISVLHALVSAALAALVLVLIELTSGMTLAYLADIAELVAFNEGSLVRRLFQAVSRDFGIYLCGGLTALSFSFLPSKGSYRNHPALWIIVGMLAGIFYESQNTGSQALIFLWPIMVVAIANAFEQNPQPWRLLAVTGFAAATLLPPAIMTIQSSARAMVSTVLQNPLEHKHLGRMGAVTIRPVTQERVDDMRAHWIAFPEAMQDLALVQRQLPSFLLFSDLDFQARWLIEADRAVVALKQREENGLTYETILTLDFTSPFAWIAGKTAPKHVSIGSDPFRAMPAIGEDISRAIAETDIVLKPLCPLTDNVERIQAMYAEALSEHEQKQLTPCFAALIHPRLQSSWQE